MATHSSVLAWRIPGTGEPGGLPSMWSHRVGHDCSDLAAVAAAALYICHFKSPNLFYYPFPPPPFCVHKSILHVHVSISAPQTGLPIPFSGGLPWWLSGKESTCQCRKHRSTPGSGNTGRSPWRRRWPPTPVFLPGESCGQRSLMGYSPWCRKDLNTT